MPLLSLVTLPRSCWSRSCRSSPFVSFVLISLLLSLDTLSRFCWSRFVAPKVHPKKQVGGTGRQAFTIIPFGGTLLKLSSDGLHAIKYCYNCDVHCDIAASLSFLQERPLASDGPPTKITSPLLSNGRVTIHELIACEIAITTDRSSSSIPATRLNLARSQRLSIHLQLRVRLNPLGSGEQMLPCS